MGKLRDKWISIPLTVRASSAYAICSILQKCLSFITLPLFTRLLTTEQYGQVTIYHSWHGILSIILTLNLAYGSFSTAMVKFEDDRDGYISSVEGVCVALSLVFLAIYLPFSGLWNRLFELPTYIICIMVAEMLGTTALLFWSGRKRFEFDYKSVVAVTLVTSITSVIVQLFLVMTSSEKGYAKIIGNAVVNIAVGGFFFIWNLVKGKKALNKEYWAYALGFNIPLLAYYLSQVVFNQSDRIMISHMVGTDKAAVYGVAYNIAMVLTFVLNAINNSYVPWYYGKIKEGNTQENRVVSLGIAALMAIMLLGITWFAPEIILVLAGDQYAESVYVITPVAASLLALFYAQLFINVEFYYEEKKKLVWASIGAAVVNFVLNYFLIGWFGFVSAAYTTLISYIIFAASNYWAMKQVMNEHQGVNEGLNYRGLVGLFVGFGVTAILGTLCYPWLLLRIAVALVVLIGIYMKRNAIKELLKTFKS